MLLKQNKSAFKWRYFDKSRRRQQGERGTYFDVPQAVFPGGFETLGAASRVQYYGRGS